MAPTTKKKKLDLVRELKKGNKIYVLNRTNPRGVVFLMLMGQGGKSSSVQIPATPHPFCLSDHAPNFALNEGGMHLRTLLSKKHLKLISQKRAEEILQDRTVQKELDSALQQISLTNADVTNYRRTRGDDRGTVQVTGMDRQGNPVTAHATGSHVNEAITFVPSEPQDQQQINPRLQVIIEQFKAGELTSKSAKLQIAQFSDHLKPNEWAYLNDNTHGSLRDYAVEKLSGIRGSLNSPDIEEDSEEDSEEDDEDSESASENDELATDEETNETDDEDSDEDDESSEEESEEVAEPPTDVNTDQVLDARPLTPEEIAARMSNPTPPPPISRSPKKKLKKHRR